ncbi:MAG: hypothetical protein OXN27_11895 [Candidatus Poribacteria bacterium]|nr:hypothetical protein [Candidatus Poribacteria bacterium]
MTVTKPRGGYGSISCLYVFFLILLGLFGCTGEKDILPPEDPASQLVGTWELLTIDGKTPIESLQGALTTQEAGFKIELYTARTKLVFASDTALYRKVRVTFDCTVSETLAGVHLVFRVPIDYTTKGNYVVAGTTLEMIYGEVENFTLGDFQWTHVDPRLKDTPAALADFQREFEQGFSEGFQQTIQSGLKLSTYTWSVSGARLTLTNDTTRVYRKM